MNVGVLVNTQSEDLHMFTSDLQPWSAREEVQDCYLLCFTLIQVVLYMEAALGGSVDSQLCCHMCVYGPFLEDSRSLTTGQNCQG